MSQPKISIIILHLCEMDGLLECLSFLGGVSYGNFDVFVVQNGPEGYELKKRLPPFPGRLAEIIYTGKNLGFAAGNNIGIKRALQKGADYVLLLNDDTVVSPDFLDILVAEAEKDPLIGMLGPEVLCFRDRERVSFAGAKLDPVAGTFSFPRSGEFSTASGGTPPFESDYITGCALLVKKSLLDRIGLLDERFFLYWEDSDWGLRAKKAGFRCLVVPAARIWHKVSASSGGNDSPLKAYHKTRSHLLFAELHAPPAKKKLLLQAARDIVWLVFKSGAPGAFRRAAAYAAAVSDYLRGRGGAGPAWLSEK